MERVFLATDSRQPELLEDVLTSRGVRFSRYGGEGGAVPSLSSEFWLPVDILMCAEGSWFLGNVPSTVTEAIQQDRDNLGHPRNRTRFFGFGAEEAKDFDSEDDPWLPTDAYAAGAGALPAPLAVE